MNAVTMQISKATARLETGSNVVYVRPSSTVLPICLHLPIRNALTTDDAGAKGLAESRSTSICRLSWLARKLRRQPSTFDITAVLGSYR